MHTLDEADEMCPKCGGELQVFGGQFEEADEIDVVERRFVLVKHKRQKYRCACGGCIETAQGPVKLQKSGRYSVGFATAVAVGKYADHLPLQRQVVQMRRQGLQIDSQTLWDQLFALSSHLEPAYEALHEHVLSHPVVGADETTWRLMGQKAVSNTKRWQVWALSAPDATAPWLAVLSIYQGFVEGLPDWRPPAGYRKPSTWVRSPALPAGPRFRRHRSTLDARYRRDVRAMHHD